MTRTRRSGSPGLRWQRLAVIGLATLTVSFLGGARPLAIWLARPLVKSDPLRHVDAIVVLGAGSYGEATLTPASAYRLLYGVRLLKDGYASVLVLSGGGHRGVPGSDVGAMASTATRNLGIDSTALVLDERASSTAAQAVSVARIAGHHDIKSIVLVTSPLKSYRAARAFQRVGLEVTSSPGIDTDSGSAGAALLLVAEDHLPRRLSLILESLHEYVAIGLYWAKGWI